MLLKIAAVCHPGSVREKNEDTCLVGQTLLENTVGTLTEFSENLRNRFLLTAVFDGMGGISAGEVASRLAAKTALALQDTVNASTDYGRLLHRICLAANDRVCKEMMHVRKRMGSTASMIFFREDAFTAMNLGDSPMYLWRNDSLKEIYRPHNERESYEREHGPCDRHKKFRLTQHIGIFHSEKKLEPIEFYGELLPDDRFILCSDGLTDMIEQSDLENILSQDLPPKQTVSRLLEIALANGGKDNISIICVEAVKEGLLQRLFGKH